MQQTILQTFTVVCRPWRSLMMVCNTLCCTEEHFSKVFQVKTAKMFLELRMIFWKIPVSLEARKQGTNLSLFFILSSAPTGPLSTVRMTDSYQSALEVVHMRGKKGHTSQYVKACFIFNKFYDATRFIVTAWHSLIHKISGKCFYLWPLSLCIVESNSTQMQAVLSV